MKYHYFYQAGNNRSFEGEIVARNRNDAYTQLRKRGIKPYKMYGNDPVAWKRWAAIGGLAIVVVFLLVQMRSRFVSEAYAEEPRGQIYGDPAFLQEVERSGWTEVFADVGEAWLARHAQPGLVSRYDDGDVAEGGLCDALTTRAVIPLEVMPTDSEEVAKMKRMVNGMKSELRTYLAAGGRVEKYVMRVRERVRTEEKIREEFSREMEALKNGADPDCRKKWTEKNLLLREMGLRTEALPDEW